MTGPIAYGIDFGTTNTVVAAAYEDRTELLPLGDRGSDIVPSVLLIDEQVGNFAIGEPAWRQMMANPAGKRFVFAIKGALSEPSLNSVVLGDVWTPQDFVQKVFELLKRNADRAVGADVRRVVIGHPVAFEGAEGPQFEQLQALAMQRLRAAAHGAGFDEVELMAEPAAAVPFTTVEDGNLLAVDFGGGTIDMVAARIEGGSATAAALKGAAIGGQRFDAAIFRAFVAEQGGLEREYILGGKSLPFPSWIRERFCNWLGLQKLMRDATVARSIHDFMGAPDGSELEWVLDVIKGGQAHRFLRALESAKIDLTSRTDSAVVLDWPGVYRRLPATRGGFDAEIAADVDRCMDLVDQTVYAAGMDHSDVTMLVRTGGSAQVPLFCEGLERRFGGARQIGTSFFSSVASGLAEYAQECWT